MANFTTSKWKWLISKSQDMIVLIHDTLKKCLSIEHGGGENDAKTSRRPCEPSFQSARGNTLPAA
jgi:hypothetical protein